MRISGLSGEIDNGAEDSEAGWRSWGLESCGKHRAIEQHHGMGSKRRRVVEFVQCMMQQPRLDSRTKLHTDVFLLFGKG